MVQLQVRSTMAHSRVLRNVVGACGGHMRVRSSQFLNISSKSNCATDYREGGGTVEHFDLIAARKARDEDGVDVRTRCCFSCGFQFAISLLCHVPSFSLSLVFFFIRSLIS